MDSVMKDRPEALGDKLAGLNVRDGSLREAERA